MNSKISFWKRAAIVLPALILVCLLVLEEDKSPIGKLIAYISNSSPMDWIIGGAILLVVIAAVIWMLAGLIPRKPQNNSTKKTTSIVIAVGLSLVMAESQTRAMMMVPNRQVITSVAVTNSAGVRFTAEEQARIDQQANWAVQVALGRLAEDPTLTTATVTTQVVGILGTIAIIVIIVVVIAGVIYIGYKLYKAVTSIGEKRKKDIDGGDGDKTNTVSPRLVQGLDMSVNGSWAASFFRGYTSPPTADEVADCNCQPPFSFSFVVPSVTADTIRLVPYLPTSANMVPLESFYTNHGLSTNLTVDSYSVNNQPTNGSSVITYDGVTAKVTFDGMSNVVMAVERSSDLIHWEKAGTLSAPSGARISFGDNETSSTATARFYRVQAQR